MKIKKYDAGGMAIYAPFISSRGIPQQPSAGVVSESKSSEKTAEPNYWDKEFLKIAEENALPSDFAAGYQELMEIAQRAQSLSGTSLFGGPEPSMTMSDVLQAKFIANKWKAGRDAFDKASQNLTSEKAWNEVATTSTGNIYVYKDNGITTITPEEFAKNIDDYAGKYLTNSELLAHRHDDIAYHDKWSIDVGGTIGLQTIHKQLLDTIKEFSTTSISEYVKRTGNNVSQSAWKGMQILLGEGPDGYYKVTTKTEMEDVNAAVRYLWNTIGEDGRAKLKAEVAIQGKNPNKADDRYELILSMLQMHTDYTQDPNFEKSATEYDPDGDGKGSNPGDTLTEGTLAIEVARGNLTETTAYMSPVAQKVSDKAMMSFKAWNAGQLQDRQGDVLHANNLQDLLPNVEQAKAADTSTIVFGNQILSSQDVASVVWDGRSLATRVALPKKYVNGKQVPDFDLMIKLNELNAWISDNPGVTSLEIQSKMKELVSEGIYFDSNTKQYTISPERMGFFLSFAAYGSDDLLDITDASKPFLQKLSRKEGKQLKSQFNNYVQFGKATPVKKEKQKNNFESSEAGDFYYGNIYIPIVDPLQATITTTNQYYPKSTFMDSSKQAELSQQILAAQQQTNWKLNF